MLVPAWDKLSLTEHYYVRVGDSVYTRNRHVLIAAGEPPIVYIPDGSENLSKQPAPHQLEAPVAPASASAPPVVFFVPPQPVQPSLRH